MATKNYILKVGQKPTPKQLEEVKTASKRPIVYDDDCPEFTDEQLALFHRVSDHKKLADSENETQDVTLQLSSRAVSRAKSLGASYTHILAQIIENALDDPSITKALVNQ